eukprot:Platyproteum_vivax@DN3360_c0_g1_i2.p2
MEFGQPCTDSEELFQLKLGILNEFTRKQGEKQEQKEFVTNYQLSTSTRAVGITKTGTEPSNLDRWWKSLRPGSRLNSENEFDCILQDFVLEKKIRQALKATIK